MLKKTMANRQPGTNAAADGREFTRRQVLAAGAAGALMAAGVAGCGSASPGGGANASSGGTAGTAGPPKRGGTLRIGMITGGSAELVIPSALVIPDWMRTNLLYDPLFRLADDLRTLTPMLALSAESNRAATIWTFSLRPGVKWHNGRDFTAADVVYTIRSWQGHSSQTFGKYTGVIDYKRVKARGKLTVEVPLVAPMATFPAFVTGDPSAYVVPDGVGAKELERHPVGTGPFMYKSFVPGTRSVFVRNTEYWQHGKPFVDSVVVDSSFTDETSRLNALLANEVDILPNLPPLEAKQIGSSSSSSSAQLLRSHSPIPPVLYMDVKRPPFSDVRVRQAMRLVVDRQALINDALAGYGTVGNDLLGPGAEFFAKDLVRERDVEQAKSLLKAAGQADLKVSIATSAAVPGFIQAATLFAAQAAEAGITISPQTINPNTYFNPPNYPYTFGEDLFGTQADLPAWYTFTYKQYDDTRWGFDKGMQAATVTAHQSEELWRAVQESQFRDGGFIVWAYQDNLDALANRVHGLTASPVTNVSNFSVNDAWLS